VNFRICCRNLNNTFAGGSSKEFLEFTHMPFIYRNHPGKIAIKAMQPLPAQGSLPAVESDRGWLGERLGMGLRLPLTDSWRWLGQWSLRRHGDGRWPPLLSWPGSLQRDAVPWWPGWLWERRGKWPARQGRPARLHGGTGPAGSGGEGRAQWCPALLQSDRCGITREV
jgi:hypothetical protein